MTAVVIGLVVIAACIVAAVYLACGFEAVRRELDVLDETKEP